MWNGARSQQASIERRRNNEKERKARIFNDKVRTIGIDKEGLDKQLEERKREKDAEKLEQDTFDAQMLHNSKQAHLLQIKQEREKQAKQRASYQDQYEKAMRQRELDRDVSQGAVEHMMPPGMAGEDPESDSRVCRQREQLREWLLQQQEEQAWEKERQKMEKLDYDKLRVHMDSVAMELENAEKESRKKTAVETTKFNQTMAEERHRQERELKDNPLRDLLPSKVGAPGLFPSRDRRPPAESWQQMKKFWNLQIQDKMMSKLEGIQEAQHYDRFCSKTERTALIVQRQQEQQRKQLRQQLDHCNNKAAEYDRRNRPDIKRGGIDDSFFSKFNTCSR
ncbi:RIB43A-like with coiled-coils protein 2 [Dunckerocampus dactyliophorus]|uniref:RIB43A-like with coiled-coils protein 2 n=1 Tax=Dunckerocampus dactyliophorus TaxID=161453 RepID=UPI0024057909|nr:RIB43A-like with coiled-coils protein 2 [Dunckerocampus dactyliophorus]